MGSVRIDRSSAPGADQDHARRASEPAAVSEVVFGHGAARAALASPAGLRELQRSAGNTAATRLVLQLEYDMREYTGHTPSPPYTEIHFRFDTDTLPTRPHEFLHITVQNADRSRVVHYYYDSWTNTWRRPGAVNPLGADLGAVQAAAITWGEQKAQGYGTQFRQPAAAAPQAQPTAADWVDLGALTPAEIQKQAKARAREEQQAKVRQLKAEQKRLEAEARKAQQELVKKQKAEREAQEKARREAEEAQRKARLAAIENLAYCLILAFDLRDAVARARATELVEARETGVDPAAQRQGYRPISEEAMSMYG